MSHVIFSYIINNLDKHYFFDDLCLSAFYTYLDRTHQISDSIENQVGAVIFQSMISKIEVKTSA